MRTISLSQWTPECRREPGIRIGVVLPSDQMHTIRSRLDDAEEALQHLESLRPSDPAVQNARDEVDRMRSHMDRLSHENWRGVRPDLETTSSSIEDEASSVVEADDD